MTNSDQTESWENGWNAHKQGMRVDDNPYSSGLQARSHYQWQDGWHERYNIVDRLGIPHLTDEKYEPFR